MAVVVPMPVAGAENKTVAPEVYPNPELDIETEVIYPPLVTAIPVARAVFTPAGGVEKATTAPAVYPIPLEDILAPLT